MRELQILELDIVNGGASEDAAKTGSFLDTIMVSLNGIIDSIVEKLSTQFEVMAPTFVSLGDKAKSLLSSIFGLDSQEKIETKN